MLTRTEIAALALFIAPGFVMAQAPGRRAESPAAADVPATAREQSYAPELVEAGRELFSVQCAFCHGLDAAGASGGADLTRSELVAGDFRGDAIGPVIRSGRPEAAIPMPSFANLSGGDVDAIVAFIHDQKSRAESVEGGRRSVSADDLQTGDARAGERYFEANCTACHRADGDLEGVASRFEGLALLQRMLYPRPRGPSPTATPSAIVIVPDGSSYEGLVEYHDEFMIAITDGDGRYRSFDKSEVNVVVRDPLEGHVELLRRYTDKDMHDVLAYLQRLR